MALATGATRRLNVCVVGKIAGGNQELVLTAQENEIFIRPHPALGSCLEQKPGLLDDRKNRYKR
jgi:hypothetical protein